PKVRAMARWTRKIGTIAMVVAVFAGVLPVLTPFPGVTADSATVAEAVLPTGRDLTSAIWDGENAYIFGGWISSPSSRLDEILRYNSATDSLTTLSATLPIKGEGTSAVWDGTNAYIFGGDSNSGRLDKIVRFNPATHAVTTMSAKLPSMRDGTSAVWDGTNAYIFGGYDGSNLLNQIVRYNPATNTVTAMSTTLPSARFLTSAVWDGTNAYIFGGWIGGSPINEIVRYNPSTNMVTVMSATLPSSRYGTSAIWDGANAYVFGGGSWGGYADRIFRYNLAPAAPGGLVASPGPGAGQITLSWAPPANNTYSVLSHYHVYRSQTPGGPVEQIAEIGTETSFVDSGLPSGATRYYRVSGVNAGRDEGPMSNLAGARTHAAPSAPSALVATPSDENVFLTWQPPASNGGLPVSKYHVYRGTTLGGPKEFIGERMHVTDWFPWIYDRDCPVIQTCVYVVTAVNEAGEGAASNEAIAVGLLPASNTCVPYNPQALTNACFRLEWTTTTVSRPHPSADPRVAPGGGVCIVGNVCAPGIDPRVTVGSKDETLQRPGIQGYFELTFACGILPQCRLQT
ncbi:MAG TPA: kelch repeat-containing protein, partial [Candidatus Thermoplasmatota archaeon]|nr:kelch repeat-containing protein [Candidatus Thermoplasmatota archaeon]